MLFLLSADPSLTTPQVLATAGAWPASRPAGRNEEDCRRCSVRSDPFGTEDQGTLQTLAHRVNVLPAANAVLAVLPLFLVGSQSVVLQRDLGFGRAQLGLATSACYAASALTAVPLGRLIQRTAPHGAGLSGALSFTSLLVIGVAVSSWW